MKAMKPAMMDDAIMMIIMVTDMVMGGLAMWTVATILTYTNTWIIATIHTIIITLTREMTTFNTKTNTLISTTCKATTTYTVNFTAIVTFLIFLFFSSAMFTLSDSNETETLVVENREVAGDVIECITSVDEVVNEKERGEKKEKKARKDNSTTASTNISFAFTKVSLSLFLSLFVSSSTFIAVIVTSVSTSRLTFEQSHVAVLHF
jgi:hypothetical protein